MLLEEKLTLVRFPPWCNVFDDNVAVLDEKLPYESLTYIKINRHYLCSPCNVLRMKANSS